MRGEKSKWHCSARSSVKNAELQSPRIGALLVKSFTLLLLGSLMQLGCGNMFADSPRIKSATINFTQIANDAAAKQSTETSLAKRTPRGRTKDLGGLRRLADMEFAAPPPPVEPRPESPAASTSFLALPQNLPVTPPDTHGAAEIGRAHV